MSEETSASLEQSLGYSFTRRDYLTHALTHSSRKNDLQCSNERLEFLGDAILGAVISHHLYHEFGDYSEGELTRVKSAVVSRASLARVARELDLGKHLIVAKGVARASHDAPPEDDADLSASIMPQKMLPNSLLANAFEAIIAAVHLDGGFEDAKAFILHHMRGEIERAQALAHSHNFKSALQHFTQREMGISPVYRITAEEGPDHVKRFEVVAVIGEQEYATGRGNTKKAAEQLAAEETLNILRGEVESQSVPSA